MINNIVFLVIILALGFNFRLSYTPSIFFSNILVIILILITISKIYIQEIINVVKNQIKTVLIIYAFIFLSLLRNQNPEFLPNFLKIVFILFSFYGFLFIFRYYPIYFNYIITAIVLGIILSVFTSTNFFEIQYLNMKNRLSVEMLGNYNTYAILISISLTFLFYLKLISDNKKFNFFVFFPIVILLMTVLVVTYSRGGFFTLLLSVIIFSFINKKINLLKSIFLFLFITLLIIIIDPQVNIKLFLHRFLFINDPSGNGRVIIFNILFDNYFNSIITFLFGKGPGSIYFVLGNDWVIKSGHSTYLDVLYQYGLCGFLAFIYFLRKTYNKIKTTLNYHLRTLLLTLYWQFCFSSLFDSYYNSTPTLWVFSLIFAFFWSCNYFIIEEKQYKFTQDRYSYTNIFNYLFG